MNEGELQDQLMDMEMEDWIGGTGYEDEPEEQDDLIFDDEEESE